MTKTIEKLVPEERTLSIKWADGHKSTFHYIWLRDNCPLIRHANGQRLIETANIPPDIHPHSVTLKDGKIEIVWDNGGHISCFSPQWLRNNCYCTKKQVKKQQLWDASLTPLPKGDYKQLCQNDEALKEWLSNVYDYGFAILSGVPVEDGAVTEVVKLFGYVRETNYGPYFDVKSVADPNNLAYTSMTLSCHTDNGYRDPVPTLQLLHCLSSSASGGESIVVDGFCVAEALRERYPEKFHLLSTLSARFCFRDKDTDLMAESPLINLSTTGEITSICFNNRSIAPFNFEPQLMESYYDAYRTFALMLESSKFQIRFALKPGELFVVDNLRVLHGRTGFQQGDRRHLQGCYADRDGLYSRLRVLAR